MSKKSRERQKLRRLAEAPKLGMTDSISKADWSSMTSPLQIQSLEILREENPRGFLVKHGDEFGWMFEISGIVCMGSANDRGEVQFHENVTPMRG